MKKTITLIGQQGLESSSGTTPEFLAAFRAFKSEFTAILKNMGCTDIEIGKGHFYISGFFKATTGQLWYFSLSDLRTPVNRLQLLYRTAKNNKDFTGGGNRWADLNDLPGTMIITAVEKYKIKSARITPMPTSFTDLMPEVIVITEDGKEHHLFEFYPDEITFIAKEFEGLTLEEARGLKFKKDKRYLQS